MKTIWLFRHAESELNTRQNEYVNGRSNETPLTEKGKAQAQKLGLWIAARRLRPDIIFTSPAVRTRDTARFSLKSAGVIAPIISDNRLQEMSQGIAEGMRRDDVYTKDVLVDIQSQLTAFKLPGGESMDEVRDRAVDAVQNIKAAKAETTFVYTHGFWIRCLVGSYNGWDHTDIRTNNVANASATQLVFHEDSEAPAINFNIDTQSSGAVRE